MPKTRRSPGELCRPLTAYELTTRQALCRDLYIYPLGPGSASGKYRFITLNSCVSGTSIANESGDNLRVAK